MTRKNTIFVKLEQGNTSEWVGMGKLDTVFGNGKKENLGRQGVATKERKYKKQAYSRVAEDFGCTVQWAKGNNVEKARREMMAVTTGATIREIRPHRIVSAFSSG